MHSHQPWCICIATVFCFRSAALLRAHCHFLAPHSPFKKERTVEALKERFADLRQACGSGSEASSLGQMLDLLDDFLQAEGKQGDGS